MKYTIETYIWNQTEKNEYQDHITRPSGSPTIGMFIPLRKIV